MKNIYKRYQDIALLSKFAGGIGVSVSNIRSSGSLIKGTNGKSNGIVPWLHTLSSSVVAVNQCFTGDTLVQTNAGTLAIADIKKDDVVITSNGPDEVQEILVQEYNGPLITLETSRGLVQVTPGHPILVVQHASHLADDVIVDRLQNRTITAMWVEAQNVTVHDAIVSIKQLG